MRPSDTGICRFPATLFPERTPSWPCCRTSSASRVTGAVRDLPGQGGAQVHQGQDGIKEETLNSQTVNMEAVAELKAVYVNNSAEYARVGYFDTITKSGTNEFHGEGSYYHRNSALGARGFFDEEKTKVIYHTFNVSAAGPIIKNKTFFYALWNGERVPGRAHYVSNVPTQQMRNGDFSQLLRLDDPITLIDPLTGNPFPGNVIPQDRLSGVAQKAQDRFFPLPNRGGADALVSNLGWTWPHPDRSVLCRCILGSC